MNDVLSQLQDIQTPDAITYWPLAWGWWVLIILVLALLVLVTHLAVKAYRFRAAMRQANKLLIEMDTTKDDSFATINILLKRLVLAYSPREQVANLQGKDWLTYLNQTVNAEVFAVELAALSYQSSVDIEQTKQFHQQSLLWLKKVKLKTLQQGGGHV